MVCPNSEQIELLTQDSLESTEVDKLRQHIEQCEECRRKLEECHANEQFLSRVKCWPDADLTDQLPASDRNVCAKAKGQGGTPPGPPSDSFPGYSVVCELHRGGQGIVYQAIHERTRRKVAIKVMREGPFAGDRDRGRFERELQVLGALNHPNIVAVNDSGIASGSAYFVMDYIPGQPLDVYMAGAVSTSPGSGRTGANGRMSVKDTFQLFAKICDTVNAAHLQGVIHRDLKPSNIRIDPSGEPHILDFGLAKIAADRTAEPPQSQAMTVTGQFMGTMPWASPEQAEADHTKIDIRTDVYSLGVILYQMLAGQFPYSVVGSMHDVLHSILNAEPVRPSAIRRDINDEVSTIVLKCLAKERERRYQTAGELARDIRHYLDGRPIEAKRDSSLYVLRKTLRRHRASVAAVCGFAVVVAVALATSLTFWGQAVQQRDEALAAEVRAKHAQHAEAEARTVAEESGLLARRHLYSAHINLALRAWEKKNAYNVMQDLAHDVYAPGHEDLRTFEWYYLWQLCHQERCALWPHLEAATSITFSPDGKTLATSGANDVILWDLDTARELALLIGHTGQVNKIRFFPDGKTLVSASFDGTIRLWDIETGSERSLIEVSNTNFVNIAVSPDETTIAAATEGASLLLWNLTNPDNPRTLNVPRPFRNEKSLIEFRPDGMTFVTAYGDGTATLWRTEDLEMLTSLGVAPISDVPVPPNPRRVRFGEYSIRKDPAKITETCVQTLAGLASPAALSPDGQTLALAGPNSITLWDVTTGVQRDSTPLTSPAIAFAPDGTTLAIADHDGTIDLWNLQNRTMLTSLVGQVLPSSLLVYSPDGSALASVAHHSTVRIWDVLTGTNEPPVHNSHAGSVTTIAASPSRQTYATAASDGTIAIWDAATRQERLKMIASDVAVGAVGFLSSPPSVLTADYNSTLCQWDPETGQLRSSLALETGEILSMALSPDGETLAIGRPAGTVELWNTRTGRRLVQCRIDTADVRAVAFSPDGKTLASAASDWWEYGHSGSYVRLWNVPAGSLRTTFIESDCTIISLAFSSDGRSLAGGGGRWTNVPAQAYVWDSKSETPTIQLVGHSGAVESVAFSPDSKTLATGSADGTLRFWDLSTQQERAVLKHPYGSVTSLLFSDVGTTLISGSTDGTVTLLRAATDSEVEKHPDCLTTLCVLSTSLRKQGKPLESEQTLRHALQLARDGLGENSPGAAVVMLKLGLLLSEGSDATRRVEAVELFSGVLAFARRHRLLDFHELTLAARDALSDLSREMFQLGEEQALRSAIEWGGAKALVAIGKSSVKGVAVAIDQASTVATHDDLTCFDQLICGEYLILGDQATAAAGLIEQAISYGGQDHFYYKSLGWALLHCDQREAAATAFRKALNDTTEWSLSPPKDADPDHWTAAYYLGLVSEEQYTDRWQNDSQLGERLAAIPWFYVGQRREIEGDRQEAISAYQKSVELGRVPGAHHSAMWAAYRLTQLTGEPP